MASQTSPVEARRLAATALQRMTSAGVDDHDVFERLRLLEVQLDSTIVAYDDAKRTRVGAAAASVLLDDVVAGIRQLRDDAIEAAKAAAAAADA